jgi:hypothetical protein
LARFELDLLRARLVDQTDRLTATLAVARAAGDPDRLTVVSEYCVIHVQDCWNRFVRDAVMRSSLGGAVRSTGQRIDPGPNGVFWQRDAFAYLRANWGKVQQKPSWEPDWHEVGNANKAIDVLGPRNANDLKAAFGAGSNPITDVRPVRNFIAHRGENTGARVQAVAAHYHIPDWRQPRDIVNLVIPGTGGTVLFDEWCRRFVATATAAVQ